MIILNFREFQFTRAAVRIVIPTPSTIYRATRTMSRKRRCVSLDRSLSLSLLVFAVAQPYSKIVNITRPGVEEQYRIEIRVCPVPGNAAVFPRETI